MKVVRLNPHAPKRGNKLRVYSVFGIRFTAGTWFEVEDTAAEYLRTITQDDTDVNAPLAFTICSSREEALEVEQRALAPKPGVALAPAAPSLRVHHAGRVGVMTTKDLPGRASTDELTPPELTEAADFEDDMAADLTPQPVVLEDLTGRSLRATGSVEAAPKAEAASKKRR